MVLFVLVFGLFLFPSTLFNVGGTIPSSGMGDVITKPAPTPGTATLTVRKLQPVPTIVGTGFKPGESVRLVGVTTKRVRASAAGRFTVRVPGADPCNSISISAVGSKGSRASLNYSQLLCVEP